MRGLWLPTFSLCLLAFSFAAISLAATLVSVSHATSCHAHFVGSRLLGFLVNLCAAVIIAVVAATAAEAVAATALYKVATNNWPDTQATSVHLSLSLPYSLLYSLIAFLPHTQLQKYASKWQSSSAAADHRYCCCCLYCSWQQQLAIVATTLTRPPPLTPRPSECLKIHCTFKIEVQMLRNPHAKNARRSCMRKLTQKRRYAAKSLSSANRQ